MVWPKFSEVVVKILFFLSSVSIVSFSFVKRATIRLIIASFQCENLTSSQEFVQCSLVYPTNKGIEAKEGDEKRRRREMKPLREKRKKNEKKMKQYLRRSVNDSIYSDSCIGCPGYPESHHQDEGHDVARVTQIFGKRSSIFLVVNQYARFQSSHHREDVEIGIDDGDYRWS